MKRLVWLQETQYVFYIHNGWIQYVKNVVPSEWKYLAWLTPEALQNRQQDQTCARLIMTLVSYFIKITINRMFGFKHRNVFLLLFFCNEWKGIIRETRKPFNKSNLTFLNSQLISKKQNFHEILVLIIVLYGVLWFIHQNKQKKNTCI